MNDVLLPWICGISNIPDIGMKLHYLEKLISKIGSSGKTSISGWFLAQLSYNFVRQSSLNCLRSSISVLVFGSCPIKHVTYLMLRRKYPLLQAEQPTKLQLYWDRYMSFCGFSQLASTFIFFSVGDKSRVKWDNSQKTNIEIEDHSHTI